ncbi:MAG: DUF2029 domain-containing protein [Proteobacteria bacterium]|nr:DUF2029 domain-containing protein [Pseudomonadota bacterium]
MRRSFDVLLLFLLLIARLRLNSFAEAGLFEHFQNVAQHPLMGQLLPEGAIAAFGPWMGDPIFLLLTAISLLAFLVYVIIDLLSERLGDRTTYRIKLALLWGILIALVFIPSLKLTLLRHDNLPQSYSHDGGVIQTEATIDYFLSGRNPYIEDYYDTPMAEWGFPDFRTALEHYPYLPATFAGSAPAKLLSKALIGWYDQRFVYLLLFLLILLLVPGLVEKRPPDVLGLTMLLGLNPIMGLDLMFGQNDVFVLAWIVFSLWAMQRQRFVWSAIFFGIACAAKPTAWFIAPFWGLAMLGEGHLTWRQLSQQIGLLLKRISPALITFLILVLPYLLWDIDAFVDDVWRWSAGTAEVHYQIWGWGFANFILASGSLPDRFAYWPFWIPELLVALPLLIFLLARQLRSDTLANVCWHGAVFFLAFAYFSRFLNENYLGFLLALFALGYFLQPHKTASAPSEG